MTVLPAGETPRRARPRQSQRPEALGAALAALREQAPLVQCLTNIVAANFTANVRLVAGASPAMVDNPAEAGAFAGIAGAVLVNLGTPHPDTAAATATLTVAADAAAVQASGPGSFAVALIDSIAALEPSALARATDFI